ncbi:hypothetical protein KY284_024586 [Solanum tuberosum]|nr:hypothetical protein KY284_024586 [Solanum tuberosum]
MKRVVLLALPVVLLSLTYRAIIPPPPRSCSTAGVPSQTPKIKLRDGRNLVYKEYGVPKNIAKYNVIYVHSFGGSKFEASLIIPQAIEELGVYFVSFDRPGYGKSDPHPKRSFKSLALDIEEVADQLELGNRFYVIGFAMGAHFVWGCLKYIPHRLAGAALLAPAINYWWPGFPSNLTKEAYDKQLIRDQWVYKVAYYTPWLMYWWNTQQYFPGFSVITGEFKLSQNDLKIACSLDEMQLQQAYVTQQGEFESLHRDLIIGFGKPEFDPMDMKNPFYNNDGNIHLWHGVEDGIVSFSIKMSHVNFWAPNEGIHP